MIHDMIWYMENCVQLYHRNVKLMYSNIPEIALSPNKTNIADIPKQISNTWMIYILNIKLLKITEGYNIRKHCSRFSKSK